MKKTTVQVVETSVTVNNNCPIQDYIHPDDQTQPTILLLFLINIYDIMPWFVAIDEKGLLCQSRNHFRWQGCRSTLGVKQGKSIIYTVNHLSNFTHCVHVVS